jgi:hypothetical protein
VSAAILAFPGVVPFAAGEVCSDYNMVARGDELEFAGGKFRLHRFSHGVRLTDCDGAGKRGARLGEFYFDTDMGHNHDGAGLTAWLTWLAALPLASSYAEARSWALTYGIEGGDSIRRGVDVQPIGQATVSVTGPKCSFAVDHLGASGHDHEDKWNQPAALTRNPGQAVATKGRAALEAARADIESGKLGFYAVVRLLGDAGLNMHTWCSMD